MLLCTAATTSQDMRPNKVAVAELLQKLGAQPVPASSSVRIALPAVNHKGLHLPEMSFEGHGSTIKVCYCCCCC